MKPSIIARWCYWIRRNGYSHTDQRIISLTNRLVLSPAYRRYLASI